MVDLEIEAWIPQDTPFQIPVTKDWNWKQIPRERVRLRATIAVKPPDKVWLELTGLEKEGGKNPLEERVKDRFRLVQTEQGIQVFTRPHHLVDAPLAFRIEDPLQEGYRKAAGFIHHNLAYLMASLSAFQQHLRSEGQVIGRFQEDRRQVEQRRIEFPQPLAGLSGRKAAAVEFWFDIERQIVLRSHFIDSRGSTIAENEALELKQVDGDHWIVTRTKTVLPAGIVEIRKRQLRTEPPSDFPPAPPSPGAPEITVDGKRLPPLRYAAAIPVEVLYPGRIINTRLEWLPEKVLVPAEVEITDGEGNPMMTIKLSHYRINTKLADSFFQLSPPNHNGAAESLPSQTITWPD